ncbi:potassium-transporting ATPase subunit KdpC [Denitratisoma sp. agr-D3]
MSNILRPAASLFIALSVITGLAYPLAVTGLAKVVFPHQSSGSLIEQDGKAIGSRLIGQNFSDPGHFWGRPSATAPQANNAAASGGSNLGPTNPALIEAVKSRIETLRAVDPENHLPIPVDLVTASASGLDPHISPAAASYQVSRVARARKLSVVEVSALVEQHTEGRQFGLLGEPRVNVLTLNLDLDRIAGK